MRPSRMTRAVVVTMALAFAALPASASALTLIATTESAQDVTSATATLRGSVTVSALGGQISWQYGTTSNYGLATRPVQTSVLGVAQTLSSAVANLAPGTTYHVRAVAASGLSTAYGRDVAFTTAAAPTRAETSGGGSGSSGSGSSGSGSGSDDDDEKDKNKDEDEDDPQPPSSTSGPSSSSGSGSGKDDDKPKDDKSSSSDDDDTTSKGGDGSGATTAPGVATAGVQPVLGKTVAIAAVNGIVTAKAPSGADVDLSAAQAVPTGTLIDTRAGTVELKSALDGEGTTQTGRFWGGLFEVRQLPGARGMTQLVLRGGDFSRCPARGAVARAATKATKKRKPPRSLWGSDANGRFETKGRGSVATVRGTRWLTEDRCDGTLTRVAAGAVAVRDLRRQRTVVVTKGHHYLARVAR